MRKILSAAYLVMQTLAGAALVLATWAPAARSQPAGRAPGATATATPTLTPVTTTNTTAAEARGLFLRMQSAAAQSNFEGSLVVSLGGAVSSSRVSHYALDGQVYEMLEALDGRAHRVVRHNDTVHMLWPQNKVAVIEKRQTLGAWSTTPQAVDAFALENYEVRREGMARVAGREAWLLWLQPRDGLRYAQRFWADSKTGLMLRADVLALELPAAGARPGPLRIRLQIQLVVRVVPRVVEVQRLLIRQRSAGCWNPPRSPPLRPGFSRARKRCCRRCSRRLITAF
jgi:hypothetical protein